MGSFHQWKPKKSRMWQKLRWSWSDPAGEPEGFNGVVTLEKIYSLDPLDGIAPISN